MEKRSIQNYDRRTYHGRSDDRRLNRQCQIRRQLVTAAITAIVMIVLAVSLGMMQTKAKSDMGDITYKYYKSIMVEKGDSLWSVAERYADREQQNINDYIDEVMSINSLQNDSLMAGQYIVVPYYSAEYVG